MVLSIRNAEADSLARRLAQIDGTSVTEAVVAALREAIELRIRRETARETAQRVLKKRGLGFPANRKPISDAAWHDLDHDLTGSG